MPKGSLAIEGARMARAHGYEIEDVVLCDLDNYQTVDCARGFITGQPMLINVHNPNIYGIRGLFLSVPRINSNMEVSFVAKNNPNDSGISTENS